MKSTSFKKKSLSPLISTILLVVVAVILVTIMLAWGKETANTNLSRTDDITSYNILNDKRPFLSFVEAKNGMYVFDYFPPANKGDINFTISKYSLVGYNDFIPLEPEYTFSRTGRHFIPLGIINEDTFTISLLLSDGKYLNFENITNTNLSPSASDCPEGYIPVPGNHLYGTVGKKGGFCIMKYDAKVDEDGDGIGDTNQDCLDNGIWDAGPSVCPIDNVTQKAVSTPEGSPIGRMTLDAARSACEAIDAHLITNEEWMTITRNIEIVSYNWIGGVIGLNGFYEGHSDINPGFVLEASSDDNDGYFGTLDDDSGEEDKNISQRRTFKLTNNEIIWDLSGNLPIIIDHNFITDDCPDVYDVIRNSLIVAFVYSAYNGIYDFDGLYSTYGPAITEIRDFKKFKYKDLFLLNKEFMKEEYNVGILALYSGIDDGIYRMMRRGGGNGDLGNGILKLSINQLVTATVGTARCVFYP